MSVQWKRVKLGDVVEKIFSGGTPDTRIDNYWNGGHMWLSSGETRNKFIKITEKTITDEGIRNSSTRLAKEGDVVIASAGQGNTRGQVSYVNDNMYINQSLIAIRSDNINTFPLFIFYNLSNRYKELRGISEGNSIRGSLTTKMFSELPMVLPPFSVQQSIAQILFSLDKKIELLREQNNTLEALAQTLFKRWFIEFEFSNKDGRPYKSNGGKMTDSDIGPIPEGWRVGYLKNFVSKIFSGGTPDTRIEKYWDGTFMWMSSGETCNKYIHTTMKSITIDGIQNSSTKLAKKGDVLMASAGQGHTRGQVSLCLNSMYINQSIISIRSTDPIINSSYVFYGLLSRYDELRQLSEGNSIRGSLTTKIIGDLVWLYPSEHALRQYATIIKGINKKINRNIILIGKYTGIRDLILPRLMKGEIEL